MDRGEVLIFVIFFKSVSWIREGGGFCLVGRGSIIFFCVCLVLNFGLVIIIDEEFIKMDVMGGFRVVLIKIY